MTYSSRIGPAKKLYKNEFNASLHGISPFSIWKPHPWMLQAHERNGKFISNGIMFVDAWLMMNDSDCFVDVEYLALGESSKRMMKNFVECPVFSSYTIETYAKNFVDFWKCEFELISDV